MFSQLLANYPMLFPLALMFSVIMLAGLVLLVSDREKVESFYEVQKKPVTATIGEVYMQDYATWDAELCVSMYNRLKTYPRPYPIFK